MRLKSEPTDAQRELQHRRARYIHTRRRGLTRSEAAAEAGVSASAAAHESLHQALQAYRAVPVPPRTRPAEPWWTEAACSDGGVEPDAFQVLGRGTVYSTSPAARRAVQVCRRCPVRRECLQDALARGETQDVRGGLAPMELDYLAVVGLRDLEPDQQEVA